jgi:hypothetical protein
LQDLAISFDLPVSTVIAADSASKSIRTSF